MYISLKTCDVVMGEDCAPSDAMVAAIKWTFYSININRYWCTAVAKYISNAVLVCPTSASGGCMGAGGRWVPVAAAGQLWS